MSAAKLNIDELVAGYPFFCKALRLLILKGNSQKNHHNHSKQISNSNKENMMSGLFNTKQEAEKAASKYVCIGAHKMGKKWMPCKMH